MNQQEILQTLDTLTLPETGKGIFSSGCVKNLEKNEAGLSFDLNLPNYTKEKQENLRKECISLLKEKFGGDLEVNVGFMSIVTSLPKNPPQQTKKKPPGVKEIILVSSGKGGVGKSTIAAGLAVTLQKLGKKTALVDADIYGPSVPTLFGLAGYRPVSVKEGNKMHIKPAVELGVKILSIGFFTDEDEAIPWRGPMISKAITQMIMDTAWGEIDVLVVDMPPGTGDIHLSMAASYDILGSIIVTTPQKVSTADVARSISMYQMDKIDIPILGIVENMAFFQTKDVPNKKYYLFGKGGAKKLSEQFSVPILGEIPLLEPVQTACDNGNILEIIENNDIQPFYAALAKKIIHQLENGNTKKP